ncbi:hypothetical protein ABFS83_04G169900 [Erythranthe nasuta]
MENAEQSNYSKRTHRRNSNGHISMSDSDSTASQPDSWHSPLRSESPLRSDEANYRPEEENSGEKNSLSIVLVDNKPSSPGKSNIPASPPAAGMNGRRKLLHPDKPTSENPDFPANPPRNEGKDGRRPYIPAAKPATGNLDMETSPAVVGVNKMVREEPPPGVKKLGRPVGGGGGGGGLEEGYGGGGGGGEDEVGGERRSRAAVASILKRSGRNVAVRKLALGFRVFEMIACLVSFSVMAADRTQGWSGDSFDRYVEYRYCVAVNVIGFGYSGFQAFDLGYHLGTGKRVISHHLHYHFDFAMDQILAYILMSASSSAATRVDDWISNWGGDEFTLMATASISMSFLAFVAFALSSLISGYYLCNRDST